MKKCIIFVRVSTERQDFSEQELALVSLAERDGYPPERQILIAYKESAIKLSEEARLGLSELKTHILSDSTIDAVYAAEISRIARSKKVLFSIEEFLVQHHIQLIILTPAIRLLKDDGSIDDGAEMAFTMYAQFAESEMRLKKQRFAQARERNKKLGRFNGGYIPLGYKKNEDNILEPSEEIGIIIEIFRKYLEGYSIVQLRDWLNSLSIEYSGQNIKLMLSRDIYKVIVGDDLFELVQEEVKRRQETYGCESKIRKYSLCEKLIRCPDCGRYYTLRSGHNYTCVYHDAQRKNTPLYCENSMSLSQRRIEAVVKAVATKMYVRRMMSDSSKIKKENEKRLFEIPLRIAKLEASFKNIEIRKRRLGLKFVDVLISEEKFQERLEKIQKDELESKAEIERLKAELKRRESAVERPLMSAKEAADRVSQMTSQELYFMVHEEIQEVQVKRSDNGKLITVICISGKHKEVYRFEGQARYFKVLRVFPDGSEIDMTKELR